MLLEKNWLVSNLEVKRDRRNRYAYFPSTVTAVRSKYNFQTIQDCQEGRNACHHGARKHRDEKNLGGEGSSNTISPAAPLNSTKRPVVTFPRASRPRASQGWRLRRLRGPYLPVAFQDGDDFPGIWIRVGFE